MTIQNIPVGTTIAGGAAVAAPATGATLSSMGVLPAGIYKVEVSTYNAGTAETTAAGAMNITVRRGIATISLMPTASTPTRMVFERVQLDGNQSINAIVGGVAATAGSVYVVNLAITRLAA